MELTTTAIAPTVISSAVAIFKLAKAGATGSAVDAVDALLSLKSELEKLLPDSNDAKANRAFDVQIHEMVLAQQAPYWKDQKESERPSVDDVIHGYKQFQEAAAKAHSNKKRRVLFNAFWNSFKPEFYIDGVREILWAKVEQLEYADLIFLKKVLSDKSKSHPIGKNTPEIEFAERLEKLGLVQFTSTEERGGSRPVSYKGLACKMEEFALEEFQFYDATSTT